MNGPGALYHFTSTAHLPWIIQSGELRPGRNKIANFPDPDFLWATRSPKGDRTTGLYENEAYRRGAAWAVRLTLDPRDFFPWADVPSMYPQWEVRFIEALNRAAEGKADPHDWWCRSAPLPLASVTAIEVKSYTNNVWRPVADRQLTSVRENGENWLGITIAGRSFFSRRQAGPHGNDMYTIGRTD